ncbi:MULTISPECIES: ArsR/SmtB family transcription factor [Pseudonocardia]|uniref:HTH-type transcriptional regulator NmtR n=2 Tax=Pseudonocardia TaxID=1847 RepID=A0A1Y2MK23_PSEAH|nr:MULTISPECIES: metalloregulator ArsR/SmtB family transcription factor [Pseudonocardia]OSY35421.1 HTH-type transcriptional regulator NmtR [Pseudonocardia autotrophica]TDN72173.1 ArsR family transcriptional regulator [Pseudonocardia autotrophica]BBG02879.1 transcriptional regulator [Pseudonocardia autotrophica]GEC27657.1 transcriptional regulator [Pseudonocardia saturnea]
MHKVPEALSGARVIDPDQVCDAVAVLSDGDKVAEAATVLDVLGEVNRLSILLALQHAGDLCVSDLAVAVGMSDSAVSHALRLLRAHGMVTAHRHGRLVRYRLADGLPRRLLEVVSAVAVSPGQLHAHGGADTEPAVDRSDSA